MKQWRFGAHWPVARSRYSAQMWVEIEAWRPYNQLGSRRLAQSSYFATRLTRDQPVVQLLLLAHLGRCESVPLLIRARGKAETMGRLAPTAPAVGRCDRRLAQPEAVLLVDRAPDIVGAVTSVAGKPLRIEREVDVLPAWRQLQLT